VGRILQADTRVPIVYFYFTSTLLVHYGKKENLFRRKEFLRRKREKEAWQTAVRETIIQVCQLD